MFGSVPHTSQQSAFELSPRIPEVFEQHGAFVRRTLRYLGVFEADIDDLTQEVFLVVHRRIGSYEEKGRTRAWLNSICLRVAFSQRRQRARWQARARLSAPDEDSTAPNQFEHVENAESLLQVCRLLEALPAEQREVFLLYELGEQSMSEIATSLRCNLQTAYSRLYKARTRISAAVAVERIASEGQLVAAPDPTSSR